MEDLAQIIAGTMGASLILFVLFVMPIWIFMHYKHRARLQTSAAPAAVADGAELAAAAERMEQRVMALEAIMDAEAPGWRTRS